MKSIMALFLLVSSTAFALTNEELERRINILSEEIQSLKAGQLQVSQNKSAFGLGNSASKVYQLDQGVSIGGYGEIFYQNKENKNESGAAANGKPVSENLRNIIYFGYRFNDKWLFNSEIEIEHVDEIFSEFLYLDYLHARELNFRIGLMLIPMGFTNELHEPVFFYSVQRPIVEQKLIPSTWRENGFGIFGETDRLQYRAYLVNGLDADGFSSSGIRSGRKKGGVNTDASTFALVGRLDFAVNDAVSVGGSIYGGKSSSVTSKQVDTTIFELHSEINYKGLRTRMLYTQIDLSNADEFFQNNSSSTMPEQMSGGYAEVGYDFIRSAGESLIPHVRHEIYDTHKKVPTGMVRDRSKDANATIVGVYYRPIDRIVFKADYTFASNAAKTGQDEFNLGFGYNY